METKVRDAESGDLAAMVKLLTTLFSIETEFNIDPQVQRKGLAMLLAGCRKHKCIKVATAAGSAVAGTGNSVVGMCTAQILISTAEGGKVALVEDMVVDPSFRRQGIGGRLMEAIETWAIDQGCRRMQLLADRTNFTALDFYDHIGWHPTRMICLRRKW